MKKITLLLISVLLAGRADAVPPEIDEPIASGRLEGGASSRNGAFTSWGTGAVDGSNYYILSTNVYFGLVSRPPGICRYFDSVLGEDRSIGENVVGYEGANDFSFLQSANPQFTRLRIASPCFDGRFGEPTEQAHRTHAYGGGALVYSPVKSKYYFTVNRTRGRRVPGSTDPAELASTGTTWASGDFDQIFIGAYSSIDSPLHRPISSSGTCRGELQPPFSETCTPTLAWNWVPLVQLTEDLQDPADGQLKTFSALPPLLAAYDSSVESLPIFAGIGARGAVLFGFMEFGNICHEWDTSTKIPTCLSGGLPSRLAAVYLTDTGGLRPTGARLHFKSGSSWIPMNKDGTFPVVPDSFRSQFPMGDYSAVKYSPLTSSWRLWGSQSVANPTSGCEEVYQTERGSSLAYADLSGGPMVEFWASLNSFGRTAPHPHYVYAPACNCSREFIFYTSTDWACYNDPRYNTSGNPFIGWEVTVRRWLDGPPSQPTAN